MDAIDEFLEAETFAVIGASTNREKYGNKVLRCYLQHDMHVVAINPRDVEIEGVHCYPDLLAIPEEERPEAISVITPPKITESVVHDAIEAGVSYIWMQPGAESPAAIRAAEDAGITVIAGGACILVTLGYDDHA